MPYIGQRPGIGEGNSFRTLDNISTYTLTIDGSSASVVSVANDTITAANHRFVQGQRVTYNNGGGSNIGGLTSGTAYFIIEEDKNSFKLATTLSNANSSVAIDLSGLGSGSSHTINVAFDGVNTKFKATYNSGERANVTKSSQLVISVNGVVQKPEENTTSPTEGFSVDHVSTIHFSSAPVSSDSFFGTILASNIIAFDATDNHVDTFTGDDSTAVFSLSRKALTNQDVLVTLDGVVQHPDDSATDRAYNLINEGATIEFASAPANNVEIQVRHIGFAGASTGGVSAFYGRKGNVALRTTDNIVTGNITSSGHIIAASANFTGNVSIGKTLTYEDVTQVDAIGLSTFQNGLVVKPGTATTALIVEGNARVTGVLTVGQGSITIDPDNDIVNIGGSQLQRDSGGDLMLMAEGTSNYSPFRASKFLIDAVEVIDNSRVGKNFSKIGIGTTNPSFPIEVKAAQPTLRLYDTDATNAYTNLTNLNGNMYLGARNDSSDGVLLFGGYGGNNFTEFFRASGTAFTINTSDDERFRVNSVGNIGIGTASPSNPLHVYHASTNEVARFQSGDATCYISFRDSDSSSGATARPILGAKGDNMFFQTGGSERLRITSDGKFGFGTNENIDERGHIETSTGTCRLKIQTGDTSVAGFVLQTSAKRFDIQAQNDFFQIYDSTAATERFRITSAGDIGIGTVAPSSKLHVFETDGATVSSYFETNQTQSYISFTASGSSSNTANRIGVLGDDILLLTNSSEKLRITSAGNVGIGTAVPNWLTTIQGGSGGAETTLLNLHVHATDSNTGSILRFSNSTSVTSTYGTAEIRALRTAYNTGYTDLIFTTSDGDAVTEKVRIKGGTGKIGIGETSPEYKVTVYDAGYSGVTIKSNRTTATDNIGGLHFKTQSTNVAYIQSLVDGTIKVRNSSSLTERLRIDSNGNVGINVIPTNYSNYVTLALSDTTGSTIEGRVSGTLTGSLTFDSQVTLNAVTSIPLVLKTVNAERLRIDTDGRTLIGRNSSPSGGDAHALNARLVVHGRVGNTADSGRLNLQRGSTASNGSSIGSITFTDNGNNAFARIETFADAVPGTDDYPGALVFSTTADGTASPTERLRITSGGDFRLDWINNNFLGAYYDSDYYMGLSFGANNRELYIDNRSNDTRADIVFRTVLGQSTPVERLRITSGGDMALGTSSPNTYTNYNTLTINGTNGGEIDFEANGTLIGDIFANASGLFMQTRTQDPIVFSTYNGSNLLERMRIDSAGRIGINASSPNTELEIQSATDPKIRLQSQESGNKRLDLWVDGGEAIGYIAADQSASQLAFRTVGTERLRITSSGDIGIGTDNPSVKLHVHEGTIRATNTAKNNFTELGTDGNIEIKRNGGGAFIDFADDVTQDFDVRIQEVSNGLKFVTGGSGSTSEKLRITAEGDMGLGNAGCSNPGGDPGGLVGATVFEIRQTTSGSITSGNNRAGAVLRLKHEAQWENGYGNTNTTNLDDLGRIEFITGDASLGEGVRSRIRCTNNLYYQNQALTFEVAGSNSATVNEVMRLTASGTLLVGRTSNYNSSPYETAVLQGNQHNLVLFQGTNSNYTNCIMRNSYANYSGNNVSGNMITFHDHGGTERGKIAIDGSSTSYITSSDYRLKENIVDMSNGITRFKQLSPRRFNWIEHPGTTVDGFIAHEVSPVVPEAVNGEKDAVDGEGNPVYQGVDNSKLVPLLAGALQEAITKIESLEARIAALES